MGVRDCQVRKGQSGSHTRQHQDSRTTQRNKRSPTTALATTSRYHSTVRRCPGTYPGIPQSEYSICSHAGTTTSNEQYNQQFNRTTTNGCEPFVERKRQVQRKRKRRKRMVQRKRIVAEQRKRIQQQLQLWQRQAKYTHWTEQQLQRIHTYQRRIQSKRSTHMERGQQRKEQRSMLQMWTDGTHGKGLPSTSIQRRRSIG